jgi:hypothetical protein
MQHQPSAWWEEVTWKGVPTTAGTTNVERGDGSTNQAAQIRQETGHSTCLLPLLACSFEELAQNLHVHLVNVHVRHQVHDAVLEDVRAHHVSVKKLPDEADNTD